MRLSLLAVALAALLIPRTGMGATYQIDPVHSYVGFSISHLVGHVPGVFKKFEGTIEFDPSNQRGSHAPTKAQIEATIDTASIDTRVEKRDADLRSSNFFDVEKYPTMTFVSKKVKAKGKDHFLVEGDLTLHGVTRLVTLDVRYNGRARDPWGGTRVGFSATTRIDRRDFGMNYGHVKNAAPSIVGDEVAITIEIEAVLKK